MAKKNYLHLCLIIDESGSMFPSIDDVIGGFKSVIDEQKNNTNGTCSVSLYKFANKVGEVYKGKDVHDVEYLDKTLYCPGGCTAMNDGIGVAIDSIGKWLNDMPEEERPEKNLIVIMTDGGENSSSEYTFERVKEMIKHQEEKYSWTFMFLGTDLTDTNYAQSKYGIANSAYVKRDAHNCYYNAVNIMVSEYRNVAGDANLKSQALDASIKSFVDSTNNSSNGN